MRAHLRAGVAVHNEGRYHAAHDAWEAHWLDLDAGPDERLLHGLIQLSAVVHHATEGNWSGAQGLADSAGAYLADLPADHRGVDVAAVRPFLAAVARDPEHVERVGAPALAHEGTVVGYGDLDFEATAVAATVLAAADGHDESAIERAIAEAREEVEAGESGPFTGLLFGFVRNPERRPVVAQRIGERVDRERQRDADVEGLFE